MLQTSLLLMKSLNNTETPIFLSVMCSLFPKAIFFTFILHIQAVWPESSHMQYLKVLGSKQRSAETTIRMRRCLNLRCLHNA